MQETKTITVTEAARNFSDIINRVYYQGNSYQLMRGGDVVALLTTASQPTTGAEFAETWRKRPRLDVDEAARWEAELANLKREIQSPAELAWDS